MHTVHWDGATLTSVGECDCPWLTPCWIVYEGDGLTHLFADLPHGDYHLTRDDLTIQAV
jgi:hypothetical protein